MEEGHYFANLIPDYKNVARETVLTALTESPKLETMVTLNADGTVHSENGRIVWKGPGMRAYTVSDTKFRKDLVLLLNWLGGLSGRGLENLSQLYKNKENGRRNIFINAMEGQAYSFTEYHKSEAVTDARKPIVRSYPWSVSKLILTYFAIVVPFHEWACPEFPRNGYVFPDGRGFHWVTNVQTDLFETETEIHLGVSINTRMYRHFQAEFDRRLARSGHNYDDHGDDSDNDDPHDTQAAHPTQLANRWYSQGGGIDLPTYRLYTRVSEAHHRVLGHESRPARSMFTITDKKETQKALDELVNEVESCLFEIHADGGWRSETQRDGVMKIVKGSLRIVCVMPTGGGKTLLITLPAKMAAKQGKTSIVLTPYRELAKSLMKDCKKAKISCLRWEPGTLERAAVIVVVTDTGTLDEFVEYVNKLFVRGLLAHGYMDECHTILTESHYRHKFERFKYMNMSISWTFLTATLAPSRVESFIQAHNIVNPPLKIIRASTNRTNARYSVIRVAAGKLIKSAIKLVKAEIKESPERKIMVFVTRTEQIDEWQEKMICSTFAAGRVGNEEALEAFNSGRSLVMVTTSALGAGMNFDDVGAVFQLGVTFSMEDFVQQSGRGGREGFEFKSITLIDEREFQRLRDRPAHTLPPSMRGLQKFMITESCRRLPLSEYMDGENLKTDCRMSNGAYCDNCDKGSQKHGRESEATMMEKRQRLMVDGPRAREVRELKEKERLDLGRLLNVMEYMRDRCAVCWVSGGELIRHSESECDILSSNSVLGLSLLEVDYETNSCCYRCGLPGDLCSDYSQGLGDECKVGNVGLAAVSMGVWYGDSRVLESLEKMSGRKWEDSSGYIRYKEQKELIQWLGLKRRVINENANNLFAVWWDLWVSGYSL